MLQSSPFIYRHKIYLNLITLSKWIIIDNKRGFWRAITRGDQVMPGCVI